MSSTAAYGSSILGYPRIGPRRELKRALESYWHGTSTKDELVAVGRDLQEQTWSELAATGLTQVPGNTFSYYDHVLDNALLFGAVPERFEPLESELDPLDFYFTHGARPAGLPAARAGAVLRHQLPLPPARTGRGHRVRAALRDR